MQYISLSNSIISMVYTQKICKYSLKFSYPNLRECKRWLTYIQRPVIISFSGRVTRDPFRAWTQWPVFNGLWTMQLKGEVAGRAAHRKFPLETAEVHAVEVAATRNRRQRRQRTRLLLLARRTTRQPALCRRPQILCQSRWWAGNEHGKSRMVTGRRRER